MDLFKTEKATTTIRQYNLKSEVVSVYLFKVNILTDGCESFEARYFDSSVFVLSFFVQNILTNFRINCLKNVVVMYLTKQQYIQYC